MQISEASYWQLISNSDKKAYEDMFRTFYAALCRYALPIMKDKDEAEEAVQTVFYNIWQKRESLEVHISVKSYLYRAVHNECLNRLKHVKIKKAYADHQKSFADKEVNGLEAMEAKELNAKIHAAIDRLPEQCGHVFRLSRFEQLRYSEIAEHLNISVKTVENHMGKALRLLRESLKDFLPLVTGIITMWLFKK